MLKKILIFLLPFISLFSDEHSAHLMSDFGGEPSGIVAGCVNAITGNFVVKRDDLVVRGQQPIRIPIRY